MKIIKVQTSKEYNVKIGSGLLSGIGREIQALGIFGTAAIISDRNVWPLYGAAITRSLKDAGMQVNSFVVASGETSKSGETYLQVLDFLAQNKVTRQDVLIALGGGVVGDLAGFAAATYLRGIPFIQVPTTLLAAVDSSVGGKTAINLPSGKNLAGAFYQPHLVVCDLNVLRTLPREIFCDGCAEVIKYAVLYDPDLFEHLDQHGLSFDLEYVIGRCVELKKNVVAKDEFDKGLRMKLNLGHTIGHAIEIQSAFHISHGKAVAIGMAIAARAAASENICSKQTVSRILMILKKFHLPISTAYSSSELNASALSDKKRFGNIINLIIPTQIGNCIIQPTDIQELEAFIEAGM